MRVDHLIGGKAVAGHGYFETVNPANQDVLAEVAAGGAPEVNAAVLAVLGDFLGSRRVLAPSRNGHAPANGNGRADANIFADRLLSLRHAEAIADGAAREVRVAPGTVITPLARDWLKRNGVTQVVCCGIATSAGVESTARFAQELGYNVTLAIDAMTDMSMDAHENSVKRIFPRLGETGTATEIIALLEKRNG